MIVIVAIVAAAAALNMQMGAPGSLDGSRDYTVLAASTLTDSISVTGTIESMDSENVYTTVNYPVESISAELGDNVSAGDILAVLDTDALVKDIQQARYNTSEAEAAAAIQLDNARRAYEIGKFSFELGEISKTDLERIENDLKIAQANSANKSARTNLAKLESQLRDSVIKAPISGTVTMVNATVGTPASGILFVIENIEDLKVKTGIKEFDVSAVKVGQAVTIKTDGTGERLLNGKVLSIAPAAVKSAAGETVSSSDVEFETYVSLTDKDAALKIGMNARMSIILAEKENVFAVPYDAVAEKDDGSKVVFAAEKQGSKYIAGEIPVETGLETDFFVEIAGTGLRDGLYIVSGADSLEAGDPVVLRDAPSGLQEQK